jgi:hypothetical protein
MKSLKDYIVETETQQVTEGLLDWAKKIFTPKDPTPQTPITAADIDAGMKDPAFVAQVQSAAAALGIAPEQLVAQLKQQVGPAAPAPAAAAAPAAPAPVAAPAAAAPAPVAESVMKESESTFEHICNTFKRDVKDFQTMGAMSEHLYDALYDYYFDDMPYGVKKARSGDPYEWIGDRFQEDLDSHFGSGIAEMVKLAGLPTVQDEGIEDEPAYLRKGKAGIGNFPAPILPRPETKLKFGAAVRPENIPAVQRSGPVSLDQVRDNSDKMSDLATLRRMAGLPDRPAHGSPL